MPRCECEVNPDAHRYTGKRRQGTLSTHRAPKHLSRCNHSTLKVTTKKFKRLKIRPVPGTRKLIAIEMP